MTAALRAGALDKVDREPSSDSRHPALRPRSVDIIVILVKPAVERYSFDKLHPQECLHPLTISPVPSSTRCAAAQEEPLDDTSHSARTVE